MHNIKPKTKYRLINVTLAVPLEAENGYICDGINETLRNVLVEDFAHEAEEQLGETVPPAWLADWRFDPDSGPVVTSGAEPAEGDLFEFAQSHAVVHQLRDLAVAALDTGDPEQAVTYLRATLMVCPDDYVSPECDHPTVRKTLEKAIAEAEYGSPAEAERILTLFI